MPWPGRKSGEAKAATSRNGQERRYSGRRLLLAILTECGPLTADALYAAANERSAKRMTRGNFAEWVEQLVNAKQVERDMTVRPWVYRAANGHLGHKGATDEGRD